MEVKKSLLLARVKQVENDRRCLLGFLHTWSNIHHHSGAEQTIISGESERKNTQNSFRIHLLSGLVSFPHILRTLEPIINKKRSFFSLGFQITSLRILFHKKSINLALIFIKLKSNNFLNISRSSSIL